MFLRLVSTGCHAWWKNGTAHDFGNMVVYVVFVDDDDYDDDFMRFFFFFYDL